jgi:1-acyl-sn-glycerol-3-phosphate acyltransferase
VTPGRSPGPDRISGLGWLRISLKIAALLLLLAGCVAGYYLWRLRGGGNPWPRRFLAGVARIIGVRIRQRGARAGGGVVLIANHVSWMDIPALGGATGAAFVAHEGLGSMPLLRWLCELNETVLVARRSRGSVARQVEQVRAAVRDDGALVIFPEGTTADGTALLPFKSSLLSALDPLPAGVTAQPVWLDYGALAARIAWVGEEPGVANFRRILARSRPIELTLHFLPPLAGAALAGRKAMAAAARDAIEQEMRRGSQRVAL